jgi:hypothetical protein
LGTPIFMRLPVDSCPSQLPAKNARNAGIADNAGN